MGLSQKDICIELCEEWLRKFFPYVKRMRKGGRFWIRVQKKPEKGYTEKIWCRRIISRFWFVGDEAARECGDLDGYTIFTAMADWAIGKLMPEGVDDAYVSLWYE